MRGEREKRYTECYSIEGVNDIAARMVITLSNRRQIRDDDPGIFPASSNNTRICEMQHIRENGRGGRGVIIDNVEYERVPEIAECGCQGCDIDDGDICQQEDADECIRTRTILKLKNANNN